MAGEQYDFICSIGELIDKLSIENIKCYDANMNVLAERKKEKPDHVRISELESRARKSGEQRVRLRDEINKRLSEALARGKIDCTKEVRTYEL